MAWHLFAALAVLIAAILALHADLRQTARAYGTIGWGAAALLTGSIADAIALSAARLPSPSYQVHLLWHTTILVSFGSWNQRGVSRHAGARFVAGILGDGPSAYGAALPVVADETRVDAVPDGFHAGLARPRFGDDVILHLLRGVDIDSTHKVLAQLEEVRGQPGGTGGGCIEAR